MNIYIPGRCLLLVAALVPSICWSANGAVSAASRKAIAEQSAAYKKLVQLRADFIAQIRYEGFLPSLPAPEIEVGDPPTFGNYDPETNILHIAVWSKLTPDEQQYFVEIAKQIGHGVTAEGTFEAGTDRWVFTHELGHWWQACRHKTRANTYEEEMGANRIASAYWRRRDPRFMAGIVAGFRSIRESIPSPIPVGDSKISYLDNHFEAISITDGYTWYQSDMVIDLASESPLPSFQRALSQPLYPW